MPARMSTPRIEGGAGSPGLSFGVAALGAWPEASSAARLGLWAGGGPALLRFLRFATPGA